MIDLHTHLLPGVDDGARTLEQAVAVLTRFAADGVRTVATTPHLAASMIRTGAAEARLAAHDAQRAALAACAPAGLSLVGGVELMLDEPGVALDDPRLLLGASRAVLVEFPRGPAPVGIERELARIRAGGIVPVVAHPERYAGVTPAHAAAWRAAGAVLQGDATTFTLGGERAHRARALLAAGAYDLLASDNHGDERTLAGARERLRAWGADEVAVLLTETNPARVLADQPPLPVPTCVVGAGVWGSVRAWLTARLPAAASVPPSSASIARSSAPAPSDPS